MEDILPVADIVRRLRELNPDGVPQYNPCPSRRRCAEVANKWNKTHPEERRLIRIPIDHRRRAIRELAIGSFTKSEWDNLIKAFNYKCAYCKKKKSLTVDHIIPLSKGGTNYITNIIPACGSCNSSKCDRLWDAQLTPQTTSLMSVP